MANNCKACDDPSIRKAIDRMISEGHSDEMVSRACGSLGVSIARSSIMRHRMNHKPSEDVSEIPFPEGMKIPPKLEITTPMRTEAEKLLETVRQGNPVDVAKDQLAKETLLSKILETHLAITAVALDRYQRGEGRYPIDIVKGLSAVGSLYEKTTLLLASKGMTRAAILEKELQRRETAAREDARQRAIRGESTSFSSSEHATSDSVRFGELYLKPEEINTRVEAAWNEGVRLGKAERKKAKTDVESNAA